MMASKGEVLAKALVDLGRNQIDILNLMVKVSGGAHGEPVRQNARVLIEKAAAAIEPFLVEAEEQKAEARRKAKDEAETADDDDDDDEDETEEPHYIDEKGRKRRLSDNKIIKGGKKAKDETEGEDE
jgi:hypothetical protein